MFDLQVLTRLSISESFFAFVSGRSEMQSGSDPPGSGLKSVRRSPRLSPQVSHNQCQQESTESTCTQTGVCMCVSVCVFLEEPSRGINKVSVGVCVWTELNLFDNRLKHHQQIL